ncbi:MAG: PilZ domain-containing protein [Deltaproteobacteria bacterium]|nr:PilZ domain-containing protein [Deltaproteobacteria bacterium]
MTRNYPALKETSDRRHQPRAPLMRLTATVGSVQPKPARVVDLSEEGICLQGVNLADRAEVDIAIPLPSRDGKVRRCRVKARVLAHEGERVRLTLHPLLPVHMLQLRDYVWRTTTRR